MVSETGSTIEAQNKRQMQTRYEVTRADLPLHCPTDQMSLWNTHPRVYLPIEESGEATCPYCGAHYVLKDDDAQKA